MGRRSKAQLSSRKNGFKSRQFSQKKITHQSSVFNGEEVNDIIIPVQSPEKPVDNHVPLAAAEREHNVQRIKKTRASRKKCSNGRNQLASSLPPYISPAKRELKQIREWASFISWVRVMRVLLFHYYLSHLTNTPLPTKPIQKKGADEHLPVPEGRFGHVAKGRRWGRRKSDTDQ